MDTRNIETSHLGRAERAFFPFALENDLVSECRSFVEDLRPGGKRDLEDLLSDVELLAEAAWADMVDQAQEEINDCDVYEIEQAAWLSSDLPDDLEDMFRVDVQVEISLDAIDEPDFGAIAVRAIGAWAEAEYPGSVAGLMNDIERLQWQFYGPVPQIEAAE